MGEFSLLSPFIFLRYLFVISKLLRIHCTISTQEKLRISKVGLPILPCTGFSFMQY